MAKLIIFLCLLVTIVCVLPTQAGVFDNRINQAQDNLVKMINGAIELFQKEVNAIVEKALDYVNELKEQGEDLMIIIQKNVDDALTKVEERINELIKGISNEVDVSECKNMAEQIKDTGLTILTNASYCVTKKIDQATEYIQNINEMSNNFTNSLLEMNEKGTECMKDMKFPIRTLNCLASIMTRTTITTSMNMPVVIADLTKITSSISLVLSSFSVCSAFSTIDVLLNNTVLPSMEACVNEKISAF
ncbi:uncharacterized protein LOC124956605 isoform X2 [Vespa velutina]|uniref:uncharacterized protein LOC124956605 isoform X2 n=1 Tax=Vespa velutina TaxID=202808 RepID=UPI001FB27185|nr:uncharacterized protein LOC124956605 isoform X2 [Vespa velutina]